MVVGVVVVVGVVDVVALVVLVVDGDVLVVCEVVRVVVVVAVVPTASQSKIPRATRALFCRLPGQSASSLPSLQSLSPSHSQTLGMHDEPSKLPPPTLH